MAKVAINGLGRIGRATLKIVMGRFSNQLVREALRIARRDGWQRGIDSGGTEVTNTRLRRDHDMGQDSAHRAPLPAWVPRR